MDIPIILLAAGASTRLGRPKQLLKLNDEVLIQGIIGECSAVVGENIFVVLGAFREKILPFVEEFPVQICVNENWENGMTSSIQTGLRAVLAQQADAKGILVVLCDQYFVNKNLLQKIISTFQEKSFSAIAAAYENTIGVPALFKNSLFENILKMDSKVGAKKLLLQLQQKQQLGVIPFSKGKYDIDTIEQLENLKKMLS